MDVCIFENLLKNIIGKKLFYTGVPDSKIKALCDYLYQKYGIGMQHIVAANEGNAVALAAGHYLATKEIPIVYMQNSGLGNIVNPVESLLRIYQIPCVFVVGWRGEPDLQDEPQHLYQGEDTLQQLELLNIPYTVISADTEYSFLCNHDVAIAKHINNGGMYAFIIRQEGLQYLKKVEYKNSYLLSREQVLRKILLSIDKSIVVSTTGKTSREIFELREGLNQLHNMDFLTVGSMGHASSIAVGLALETPQKRIWCIDGDGAVFMHMGALALIGGIKPKNMVHVVINNMSHESVGGMPTVGGDIILRDIAKVCGYEFVYRVQTLAQLDNVLKDIMQIQGLVFIEIMTAIGSRKNLGRPTKTPLENKEAFQAFILDSTRRGEVDCEGVNS